MAIGSRPVTVRALEAHTGRGTIEVVERKGIGHPDTICDAVAEHISVRLSRYYLDHFGVILHHNVDKVLLCGGAALAAFGGGRVVEPLEFYLAGRATAEVGGVRIPVHDIATDACREWLRRNLSELDLERDVKIIPRLRPGSSDLTRLFARGVQAPLANDTSCGVGFAPLTDLERVVLEVEQHLNSALVKHAHPAIGKDIKVMGVRRGTKLELTIGCAFIGRHLASLRAYAEAKEAVRTLALAAASQTTRLEMTVGVNVGDDLATEDIFLTVTGTSAEAGDDGEVGRGNRTNGLITPYRAMTLEAAAGKNPVNHVGKLYNLVAQRVAAALVLQLPAVTDAVCILVSRIGRAIGDPQVIDIQLAVADAAELARLEQASAEIAHVELARIGDLREELLLEQISVY